MKVELLEEAPAAIWGGAHLAVAAATSGHFPVKTIADILGEASSRPIAAAIGNAVFDATGVRLRQTPFTPDRAKAALARA